MFSAHYHVGNVSLCGGDKTHVLLKERKFMDTSSGAHLIFFPVFKLVKKCILKYNGKTSHLFLDLQR